MTYNIPQKTGFAQTPGSYCTPSENVPVILEDKEYRQETGDNTVAVTDGGFVSAGNSGGWKLRSEDFNTAHRPLHRELISGLDYWSNNGKN